MSLFNFLTILIVIVSILLIGIIILQEPKEKTTAYGGGAAPVQRIGINQKADFLEKATWVLVSLLLFFTFLSSVALKNVKPSKVVLSPNLAKLKEDQKSINLNKVEPKDKPAVSAVAEGDDTSKPILEEEK
ncbi:MAG: preprotein translocase subunit SecG [Amoebophilaceae bacterium]|nr:preprotein translocase subunit SecG [Amoebophilaceae bacterium]